jgi:hypothetical protein
LSTKTIAEPARELPVVDEADVLVLGGGPSGISAAVAAARMGARTILVERYGFLGGMGTAAMVTNFCGLFADVGGVVTQVVHGIGDDILARIRALGGLNRPQSKGATTVISYDNPAYKHAADQLLIEAGVRLRLHTLAVGAVMDRSRIVGLIVESKSGRAALCARTFIDCSGDADLAAWAGAPYEKGDSSGYLAYPTMMFRMGGVDTEVAEREGLPLIRRHAAEKRARGESGFMRASPIAAPQAHAGEWRMNMTQVSLAGRSLDGTDVEHMTRGEILGREQVFQADRYLREQVPGFKHSYVLEIAVLGGVEWTFIGGRGYHQVPYRALVPRGVDNLLVAGRCFSATQDAQASARVSGPCFVMGQAAGTASALSVQRGCGVAAIEADRLQASLRAQNVFLGHEP